MGEIYERAKEVIVWLNESTEKQVQYRRVCSLIKLIGWMHRRRLLRNPGDLDWNDLFTPLDEDVAPFSDLEKRRHTLINQQVDMIGGMFTKYCLFNLSSPAN